MIPGQGPGAEPGGMGPPPGSQGPAPGRRLRAWPARAGCGPAGAADPGAILIRHGPGDGSISVTVTVTTRINLANAGPGARTVVTCNALKPGAGLPGPTVTVLDSCQPQLRVFPTPGRVRVTAISVCRLVTVTVTVTE